MNGIQSLEFRREQFETSNAIKKSNRLCLLFVLPENRGGKLQVYGNCETVTRYLI